MTVCSNAVGIITDAVVFPNPARKSHFVSPVVRKSRSREVHALLLSLRIKSWYYQLDLWVLMVGVGERCTAFIFGCDPSAVSNRQTFHSDTAKDLEDPVCFRCQRT